MSLEMAIIAPHVPSICFPEKAPEYQREVVAGMKKISGMIDEIKPDAVVLISCHWMATFDHFVDASPEHKGECTADENPYLISNVPYYYPGDPELAMALVKAGQEGGIPVREINNPEFEWDYGTVVPLRHLVPKENYPVINMPVVLCANLDECYKWGQIIGNVLEHSNKKTIFVASGALSHNLVRGRENMPTLAEQAMNNQFKKYLDDCDFDSAWQMLPQYARAAGIESGGRHIATLLGVMQGKYRSQYFGFCQSSGSGNIAMTFRKQ